MEQKFLSYWLYLLKIFTHSKNVMKHESSVNTASTLLQWSLPFKQNDLHVYFSDCFIV